MQERPHLVNWVLYPTYLTLIVGLGAACVVLSIDATHGKDSRKKSGFDQGISRCDQPTHTECILDFDLSRTN